MELQVRINADNSPGIKQSAERNLRSIPNEVNFAIAKYLAEQRAALKAGAKMPLSKRGQSRPQ